MKAVMHKLEACLELGGVKKDVALLTAGALSLLMSLTGVRILSFDPAWVAIILCGAPIILEALIGLITAFDVKADVPVSLALIASVCIGEDFAAGEVAFIMQLGGLLEELTVAKARAGIEKLVRLTPVTARRVKGGCEEVIPAQDVAVDDILRVLPGESVPADGEIVSGRTSVNQAVMTGEAMPVDKGPGDEVVSGTVNQFGAFEMRATRVGEDSSIQRMVRLVQSADAGKAKIVGMADRWATWVVVIALTAAGLTRLISGEIIRAVTILVVFCPCAMVLATPTAIMAAIGNATRHGFLVREGDALERLAKVKKVAFDKTGTLTSGTPTVAAVCPAGDTDRDTLLRLAASAELLSEHPLGKAIAAAWPGEKDARDFEMLPGRGVRATVDGRRVLAGNTALLTENGVRFELSDEARRLLDEGDTLTHLAVDGSYAGCVALSDAPRPDSARMIARVKALGVTPVLLTGDAQAAANHVASMLGIPQTRAGCLPQDKMAYIDACRAADEGVCMIGDGVNDAPALKRADVGIAMGGIGSDIAVEAADIALVDDKIAELPHLLALSRRMMNTIRLNLGFSMGLNFLAITLAITGTLNPVAGALVHNAGSVLVIINSALLLKWEKTGSSRKAGD